MDYISEKRKIIRDGLAKIYNDHTGTIVKSYQAGEWVKAYEVADEMLVFLNSHEIVLHIERDYAVPLLVKLD